MLRAHSRTTLIATTLTALVGSLSLTQPAHASTPPTVESAAVTSPAGGGLSGLLPVTCAVVVEFEDQTPSYAEAYGITLSRDGAVITEGWAYNGEAATSFASSLLCDGLEDGVTYEVAVKEEGTGSSTPAPFTYQVVGHPAGITSTSQTVNGVAGWTPGKPVALSYRGGEWEAGTTFSTQVWLSKTATFTGADWSANRTGTDQLVGQRNADKPVLKFTVPTWAEGMYAWYSVVGHVDGKADYRYSFSAVPIHELPAQPKAWIKSFGKKKTPGFEVGKASRVSRAIYSAAGKTKGLKTHYQWFQDNKTTAIEGAIRRSFTPTVQYYSQLMLRVRVVHDKRAPRTRWFTFRPAR